MKRTFLLLLALILGLSLCGCGSSSSSGGGNRPEIDYDRSEMDGQSASDEDTVDEVPGSSDELDASETPDGDEPEFVYSSSLDVYSISQESYVRSGDRSGDLSELSGDEYYSMALHIRYNGEGDFSWSELCVAVDGGEKWYWTAGSMASGQSLDFHIFYSNMQKMSEGSHTAVWYIDGNEVYSDTFMLTRDLNWAALTSLPTRAEIDACNSTATLRSPYMAVWLDVPAETRYREYTIEFKADYFPLGSYYSLGNWFLDLPALERQYQSVYTEYGISGYAGFQNIYNGEHLGIMSFWDIYCADAAGNITTIRPEVIYPANPYQTGEFGGEGVGAQCLDYYNWQENHWYRVHLKCVDNTTTGNTEMEFWVCDLETGAYTLICAYDMRTSDVAFKGSIAIFLENYLPGYAGEIRTLEVRNAKYLNEATGQWCAISEASMYANGDAEGLNYAGSYDYGIDGDRLWIMTTGVGSNQDDSAGTRLRFGN